MSDAQAETRPLLRHEDIEQTEAFPIIHLIRAPTYVSPFEIAIASILLYQLLGWSAFAGFFVPLLGWPLNSLVARRSIRIPKERMGVLNELIGAVEFIKFSAWEDRAPLNVISTWVVQILQTGVALDQMAVYLSEDEVSEQGFPRASWCIPIPILIWLKE